MNATNVVLVTGTSSGFGRLIAETLARTGCTVYASMRDVAGRNAAAADALRALTSAEGLSLQVIDLDVADDASVEGAVRSVIERSGRIDVLVNNAGFASTGLNESHTVQDVQREFDVNFFGAVRMNRAVLPYMRPQRSGLIIYISSTAGRTVIPFLGIYSASKFAVEAFAESYHYQLHGLGIDTVIVQPGRYATDAPTNALRPSDPGRAAGYGEIGARLDESAVAFAASFSDPDCGDPQDLVDALVKIVAMPPGTRPLRLPMGGPPGVLESINHEMGRVQRSLLEQMQLDGLLKR